MDILLNVRKSWGNMNMCRSNIMLIIVSLLQALIPLVTHLKDKPALGGWDIINEPEGLVYPNRYDANPCFNTQPMGNNGNWASTWIRMELILRFINLQAAAIKVNMSFFPVGEGQLCPQPTQMCEYESYRHESVFGSKWVK